MKKIFLVVLALLLLVGCDPGGNKPDPTPTPDPDPVVTDPGLSQEELIGALSLEDEFVGPNGHAIYFKGTDTVLWYIDATSFFRQGKITGFEYLKDNKYKISVTVPAFAGNEEDEGYSEYVYDIELVYDPDNKRILEIDSKDFKGSFAANPINDLSNYQLEGSSLTMYLDNHFIAKAYGSPHDEFVHSYYLELERDGKTIDTAIFAKGKEQHIYETTFASRLLTGRYYYCLVIREETLSRYGGNWILVYDYKNNKTYTFEDCMCYFKVEGGRYIMNIATEYEVVEAEGSSFIEGKYVQYEFTENGLFKLNS